MNSTEMHVTLLCTDCGEETSHQITYINSKIKSIECEQCNKCLQLKLDVMKEFYREVYEKISTKPSRITEEFRQDLSSFLSRLPVRFVSKPYRTLRSLHRTRKIIKKYRND